MSRPTRLAPVIAVLGTFGALLSVLPSTAAAWEHNIATWPEDAFPLPIHLRPEPARHTSNEELATIIAASFDEWNSVSCSYAELSFAGVADLPVAVDDDQVLGWEDDADAWIFGAAAAGATQIDALGPDGPRVDILFNDVYFDWVVGANTFITDPNREWGVDPNIEVDPASVITHEVGHLLGLAHPNTAVEGSQPDALATMVFALLPNAQQASLAADDKLGLCAKYFVPDDECETDDDCGAGEFCATFSLVPTAPDSADPETPEAEPVTVRVCDERRASIGDDCSRDAYVCGGICRFTALDYSDGYCTDYCELHADCPADWHCEALTATSGDDLFVCVPGAPPVDDTGITPVDDTGITPVDAGGAEPEPEVGAEPEPDAAVDASPPDGDAEDSDAGGDRGGSGGGCTSAPPTARPPVGMVLLGLLVVLGAPTRRRRGVPATLRLAALACVALAVTLAGCGDSSAVGGAPDLGVDAELDVTRDVGRETTRDVEPVPDAQPDTDADGGEDASTTDADEVDAAPVPPVAVAGDDISGQPARPLHFDGTESYDEDGSIEAWRWTMGNGVTLDGAEVDYTYPDPGLYTVTLTVTDDDGLTASDSLRVDLVEENERPDALIDGPFDVVMGEEAEWDARDSSDDVGISRWVWTTGVDGEGEHEGQVLSYTYDEWEDRPYRLVLRVVDTDGEESLDTRDIHVMAPPVGVVTGPNEAFVGEEVVFDATESYDPDDDAPDAMQSVRWNFADGTTTEPADWFPTYTRPTHVFDAPGRYDVYASVRDADGIWRDSPTHKIDVYERPNLPPSPDIAAESFEVDECETVALSAALTLDDTDDAEDLTYFWDFGDGDAGTGIETTHAYDRAGTYEVTVTAVDSEREAGVETAYVVVNNVRPTAAFEASPTPAIVDTSVNFDATDSSDHCEGAGEDRIDGYRWEWGDGTMSTWNDSPVASHTYTEIGTYEVTLHVRDDGDPQLMHSTPLRVTVIEDDTGGGTTVDNYAFDPAISYRCTVDFFGETIEAVNFTFDRFELTLEPDAAAVRVFSGDPGTLTGTRTATTFDVTAFEDGGILGCSETYRMQGTLNPDGTIDFDLTADYSGDFCGTCSHQEWSGNTATLEE